MAPKNFVTRLSESLAAPAAFFVSFVPKLNFGTRALTNFGTRAMPIPAILSDERSKERIIPFLLTVRDSSSRSNGTQNDF